MTDQERESGHFYFGENRTSVLCSDMSKTQFLFPIDDYEIVMFPEERHMPRREEDRIFIEKQIRDYFKLLL